MHKNPKDRLVAIAVVLAVIVSAAMISPSSADSQSDYEVTDRTYVELDGMRPIGLSPDGTMLAAADPGSEQLCTYETVEFTEVTCTSLEALESRLRISDVVWSPDSSRLALTEESFVYFTDGDLWVMDARIGDLTNIADDGFSGSLPLNDDDQQNPVTIESNPAWSPDSSALTVSRSALVAGSSTGTEIVTIPLDANTAQTLISVHPERPGVVNYGMAWSPDGQYLFYSVFEGSENTTDSDGVYMYEVAAQKTDQIAAAENDKLGAPAVLQIGSDGNYLAFWYPKASRLFDSEYIHAIYDLNTGEIAPVLSPVAEGLVTAVGISPSGNELLLAIQIPDADDQLWIQHLANGDHTLLLDDLPGATVMDFGMALVWAENGSVFVPEQIGAGTMLRIGPSPATETSNERNSP